MSDAIRTELTNSSPWLIHASRHPCFESIKTLGLLRSNPWQAEGTLTYAGDDSKNFICLKPASSRSDTTPTRSGNYFFLAVNVSNLSAKVDVDISYPPNQTYFETLKRESPEIPDEVHLVKVAVRYGSITYFDTIPPEALRVRIKDSKPDDPNGWPLLADTSIEQVYFEARVHQI